MSLSQPIQTKFNFILWSCVAIFGGWACVQAFILFWYDVLLYLAIIDGIISAFIYAISSYIIANALHYYQPEKDRYSYILVWIVFLATLSAFCIKWSLQLLIHNEEYLTIVGHSLPLRGLAGSLLIGGMAIMNVLWNTQKNQNEQEKRKADAEKLAREAELYNLRQQLQPHFLFNSLNSIVALISKQPETAKNMVFQLSDFLRGTLRKDDQQFISLQEELDHLQLYLDIEKVRFGHRLEVKTEVDEITSTTILPAMITQPLLENAIKYGLYDTTGKVMIDIKINLQDSFLMIQIENPYDVENSASKKSSGFGLRSVQRRLFLLYGRTDLLQTKVENHNFIVKITIPQPHD